LNTSSEINWKYLGREACLFVLWAYIIFIGGTINGYINFKIQVLNFIIGFVVIGSWLGISLFNKTRIRFTGLERGILVFMGALIISTLFSQDVRRSISTLAIYVSYVLIFYFVTHLLKIGWEKDLIEKTLLIVGGLLITFILIWLVVDWPMRQNLYGGFT
jgi:hypothetical protein